MPETFEKIPPIPKEKGRDELEKKEKISPEEEKRAKVESVSRDDPRFSEYFEGYFKGYEQNAACLVCESYWDNVRRLNEEGIFLYETKDVKTQQERLNYIIWIYRESKYRYRPVPEEDWRKLQEKPETIERANKILIEGFNRALGFYDWKAIPRGFIIEDASSRFGMEAGNINGIRVNFQILKPLLKSIERGDIKKN